LVFPQKNAWLVRHDSPKLAAAVNDWFKKNVHTDNYQEIQKKYFELSKGLPLITAGSLLIGKNGRLSPYDSLFKKHAAAHGVDWRLLASIAYQESKFDPTVVSWSGAVGLIPLMPQPAATFGLQARQRLNTDLNILAATRLFKSLERHFASIGREQRYKMVLASFNSGLGHIEDARALARKYRKNPDRWDGDHVRFFVLLKSKPAYYEDPVCKQGYLRGSETADFVMEVWSRYQYYIRKGIK
jgi:membrane-bound lytic murein transglycosylase F